MSFEDWKKKPTDVREAALDGNKEALAAMGRKGAETANKNRERKIDIDEIQRARITELKQREEHEMRESTNEHVIDSDGNDLDYAPE